MKRYRVSDGVLVEDINGGLVEWDDVVNELWNRAIKQGETIEKALQEIRELREELLQTTAEGREADWDADNNGF